MSKELKALEDIILYLNANEPKGLYCKNIEIIKNALKDYERLLNLRKTSEWADEKLQTKKKLQAFDIIIKKLIFYFNDNAKSMTIRRRDGYLRLILFFDEQREYDLLKEVLL